jgi:hypothetical protein
MTPFHPDAPPPMPDLLPVLEAAAAHPEFKSEVLAYLHGDATSRIVLDGYAPRVKIERVLTQLLHAHPDLPVERVRVRGRSGCSDFSGEVTVYASDAEHRFAFTWCCAWRAEQQGWRDCFGFWDQARAAREFGFRCFSRWESLTS